MDTKRLFVSLALLHLLIFSACSPAATAAPTQPPVKDTQAPAATEVAASDTAAPSATANAASSTKAPSATPAASQGTQSTAGTPDATKVKGTKVVPVTGDPAAEPFVGTWTGIMTLSPGGAQQNITITIPAECKKGKKGCGQLKNSTLGCTWQLNLSGFEGGALHYKMTTLLDGVCDPAAGGGVLALDPSGFMVRAHRGPDGLSGGLLTRQAQ